VLEIAGAAPPRATCLPVLQPREARARPPVARRLRSSARRALPPLAAGSSSIIIRGRREERRRIQPAGLPSGRGSGSASGAAAMPSRGGEHSSCVRAW
jgi:hypothetical protein